MIITTDMNTEIDANEVYANLWVGSVPPRGKVLAEH
jgi:hypothetical protein